MQNDRQITISAAGSRRAARWPAQRLLWSEFVERLRMPIRGTESMEAYLRLPKARQDELKDVGGFVGGELQEARRKAGAVLGRDIIALDFDNVPSGGTEEVLRRVAGLGCAYAVYSTRKHEPARPRLRALFPLHRTATADEYEPIARRLAHWVGMEFCDPTTFQALRLMYWPSCCADGQYVFVHEDKPFADADGILATYENWREVTQWPEVPGAGQAQQKMAARQADPEDKEGMVGAFCRVYGVEAAMEAFLPGVYEPCGAMPGRYTYTGGSTAGGAVAYDNGKFLFSHHATDPAGGKLCNAFDLVRLHRFSELDDDVKEGTPTNRMPSYEAMKRLAAADEAVAGILDAERYAKANADFNAPGELDGSWRKLLEKNSEGKPLRTTKNALTALCHDPLLRGRIRLDSFADRIVGMAPLPWDSRRQEGGPFQWTDTDDAGLRDYLERLLGFRSKELISDAFLQCAAVNKFNPVEDYLNSLVWDNAPRLDTLYVDYFSAEDCPYIRAVTRKAFVAAVARVMSPGVKFDTMTVVCGPQGTGKTTLFMRMGKEWATNSLETFEGKDAAELLQGVWIVEIGELGAMNRSERNAVKSFMSKTFDQYRAPYARRTESHPRRCIFFGTTNDHDYLRDTTGNRRFWPVDTGPCKPRKGVFTDLDEEIGQLWAEAVVRWRMGEALVLPPELEAEAEVRRAGHMERDPLQGLIEEFLSKPVPEDWLKWDMGRRDMFWGGGVHRDSQMKLIPRDRVCAAEIWRECLGDRRVMPRQEAQRINRVLECLPGWKRMELVRCGADYGRQRGFMREQIPALSAVNKEGREGNNNEVLSTLAKKAAVNKDIECFREC